MISRVLVDQNRKILVKSVVLGDDGFRGANYGDYDGVNKVEIGVDARRGNPPQEDMALSKEGTRRHVAAIDECVG